MANERLVALHGCVIDDAYGANGSGAHAALLVMERMYRDLHALLKTDADWATRSNPPTRPTPRPHSPAPFFGQFNHHTAKAQPRISVRVRLNYFSG